MHCRNRSRLAATLDALVEALFYGRPIPKAELAAAVERLASRQGVKGAYADTFLTAEVDMSGFRLLLAKIGGL